MTTRLEADDLAKTWTAGGAPVAALRGVSLTAAAGETVAIVGPSGSGKTTLLAILGTLLQPDSGHVRIDGHDVVGASESERERLRATQVGFVFQRGLLVEHLTARENVALVARVAGVERATALARAAALLDRLGLATRADAFAAALSPGETQRVAVARALIAGPRLVLADEPTAHLDHATGTAVVGALRELCATQGAALVLVTHDARLTAIADRTLHLDDGRLTAA